ncbi:MAG: thioredoxin family protein [Gammaproteobacteria bacterium]
MSGIEELEGDALQAVLATESRQVLVDFWSPWCAPCRTMRPHLRRLAEEREVDWRFVAVNAESQPAVAQSFQVRALPTLILFEDGAESFRFSGATTMGAIVDKLNELSVSSS